MSVLFTFILLHENKLELDVLPFFLSIYVIGLTGMLFMNEAIETVHQRKNLVQIVQLVSNAQHDSRIKDKSYLKN